MILNFGPNVTRGTVPVVTFGQKIATGQIVSYADNFRPRGDK